MKATTRKDMTTSDIMCFGIGLGLFPLSLILLYQDRFILKGGLWAFTYVLSIYLICEFIYKLIKQNERNEK